MIDDWKTTEDRMGQRAERLVDFLWYGVVILVALFVAYCLWVMVYADVSTEDVESIGAGVYQLLN